MYIYDFIIQHKDIISTVIQLFVAMGTCGAVGVSLWLTLRPKRPKLKLGFYGTNIPINNKERNIGGLNIPGVYILDDGTTQVYIITVVNIGTVTAYIQYFGLKNHKNKQVSFFPNTLNYNETEIQPRKSKMFAIPMNLLIQGLKNDERFYKNRRIGFEIKEMSGKIHNFKGNKVKDFLVSMNQDEINVILSDRNLI